MEVDLSKYRNRFGFKDKFLRAMWALVWRITCLLFPRNFGRIFKVMVVNMFGGDIHRTAIIYSGVRIYKPWNLTMGENATLAQEVDCYNVDRIIIGSNSVVSQKAYLCSASHDFRRTDMPLITGKITIESSVWVGASAFIGMGVRLGEGCVIGATASVYKNVDPWQVVGGNPARKLGYRLLEE